MKKALLILSIICVSYFSNAQSFTFGPKIGLQTNKFTINKDELKTEAKAGFNVGAFARVGISKFFVQPELYYAYQSGTYKTNPDMSQEVKINTITIPALLGFDLFNAKLAKVYVMGGPAVAFNVNSNVSTNDASAAAFPIKSKDDLKKALWSMQLGAGVDILKFTIDARYEFGISNIYTGDEKNVDIKNGHFLLNLGYKIF